MSKAAELRVLCAAAILALAATLSGCGGTSAATYAASTTAPRTHTVAAGETVYHIAQQYGVSVGRLMTANGLSDPRDLRVGEVLVIPGGYGAAPLTRSESSAYPYRGPRESRQFAWPVEQGVVSSGFGIRNGAMHDGVDISAHEGTPVMAADAGEVIFSGALHGYGNTVIVRHDSHYATVYAHNEVNLVREGDRVARGQTIAELGATGRATGANLHFEVRRDNIARNPLAYLPEPAPQDAITFAGGGGGGF
jgi:murein DD-endopeptidase MepM/ murein hydrolase activator NlpD